MNNIISVSGGNDSLAMLLVINRLLKQDPDFFQGDTWHACYFNTGWARDGWEARVDMSIILVGHTGLTLHEMIYDGSILMIPDGIIM